MKKAIFFLLVFNYGFLKAQIPVTDVAANTNLTAANTSLTTLATQQQTQIGYILNSFQEAQKHSDFLKKSLDLYNQAKDALSKVNAVVNDLTTIQYIVEKEINIVKYYSYYFEQANKFSLVKPSELQRFNSLLTGVLDDSKQLLALSEKLLTNDLFRMSDAERISQLNSVDEKLSANQVLMDIEYNDLLVEESSLKLKNYYQSW